MERFVISIGYYIAVIAFCELARQIVQRLFSDGTLKRIFCFELFATLQVCAAVYENGLVLKHYGVFGFAFTVMVLIVIHSGMGRGAVVTPCGVVEKLLDGGFSPSRFLVHLSGQLIGGYLAFSLARLVWRLNLCPEHASQLVDFPCHLVFKAPFLIRCFYEFLGNFVIRSAVGRVQPSRKRYVAAVGTAIGLSLEISFLGPPGLNPIIAASRLLGCTGMSTQAHMAVYWASPLFGWLLASNIEARRQKAKKID